LINNVETYACVSWILRNGGNAFSEVGTQASKGTKVFALAGKIARGGLIEVPMGITLREVVMGIGGGIAEGKQFKAVQVGGPSGGCIPADLSDVPVDFESLTGLGAIMGSGGLVVLDETDCMVDIARYFLEFTQDQSCGKCTFCRIGTRRMLDILERLCNGQGREGDIEQLEALSHQVKQGSLCGLGMTAPNPVLSTIKHFRHEYEAHIEGRCPAGKCKSLITYTINDECIGCTLCAQHCPVDAIAFDPYKKHIIDEAKCIRCGACKTICPADAVEIH
jgi:NADH:ubiquinone oxidoreductase subunit F (NADH-binding)/Pyruvate/2-oxoacid:ferredoxin oxidoreductase delta subunit